MKNIKCCAGSNVLYVDVGTTYEENEARMLILLSILYRENFFTLEGIIAYFDAEGIPYTFERYSY
jgi:hypothetical protein